VTVDELDVSALPKKHGVSRESRSSKSSCRHQGVDAKNYVTTFRGNAQRMWRRRNKHLASFARSDTQP